MEKISRIIPPSARTKAYDDSRALPARAGAPTMGRPRSMEVIQDRMTFSEQLIDPVMNGETVNIPNLKAANSQPAGGQVQAFDVPGSGVAGSKDQTSQATISDVASSQMQKSQSSTSTSPEIYKAKSTVKADMIKELTNKFFNKETPKEIARESDQSKSEEVVSRVQSSAPSTVNPDSSSDVSL